MMRSILALTLFVGAITMTACSPRHPEVPKSSEKGYEATKATVNLLEPKLRSRIASEIYHPERTEDGRMAVAVNLRNIKKENLQIQVRGVFKSTDGLSTGDETAWENIYLSARQNTTYRVVSRGSDVDICTIEVRMPTMPKK